MLTEPTVLALSLAYLGLLFAVAYFGDRYARDWSASSVAPAVYGLSLAIYCTSWTFYGAVGRAATSGIDFILIYTGPALVVMVGYPMLRKMVRLAKQHNVTSIADFLASRYGKSRVVGVTATLFATVGVLPYIALQLQAVSSTFRSIAAPTPVAGSLPGVVHTDTSLIVAALMAVFTILFGVRNVQASEQHRGMMLAIAFESVVKLLALLTVGPFVLFVLFDGPADLLAQVESVPAVADRVSREGSPLTWVVTTLLVGHGLPLPAAPVPCRGGRARPSGEPPDGALAVPGLSRADQPVRRADRRRPACCCSGRRPARISTCCSCRWPTARAGCRPSSSSAACRRRPRW